MFMGEGKPRGETEAERGEVKEGARPGRKGSWGGWPPTRERWEDAEDPKAVRGLTTDAQKHDHLPLRVCGAGRRLRGWRRVEEVHNSCCGELGCQLAINEGIVERPQGRAHLPLGTRT